MTSRSNDAKTRQRNKSEADKTRRKATVALVVANCLNPFLITDNRMQTSDRGGSASPNNILSLSPPDEDSLRRLHVGFLLRCIEHHAAFSRFHSIFCCSCSVESCTYPRKPRSALAKQGPIYRRKCFWASVYGCATNFCILKPARPGPLVRRCMPRD
jgi:hypothetical protein